MVVAGAAVTVAEGGGEAEAGEGGGDGSTGAAKWVDAQDGIQWSRGVV